MAEQNNNSGKYNNRINTYNNRNRYKGSNYKGNNYNKNYNRNLSNNSAAASDTDSLTSASMESVSDISNATAIPAAAPVHTAPTYSRDRDNSSYGQNKIISRQASMTRTTSETDIKLSINLDGSGEADIDTGIGFFDHMLKSFAKHGLFDLTVSVRGDLIVDCHHTVEDVGIVLGEAIKKALGDKKSIRRYGDIILPMDEALILCAIDLSGRPYLVFDGSFTSDSVGYFDTQMVKEFFYAISYSAGMNLHVRKMSGENDHHIIEGMFKAFAKALDEATLKDARITSVLSTKGSL